MLENETNNIYEDIIKNIQLTGDHIKNLGLQEKIQVDEKGLANELSNIINENIEILPTN